MPSILVLKNYDGNENNLPAARMAGMRKFGSVLKTKLGPQCDESTLSAREAVFETLKACNSGDYGVYFENPPGNMTQFTGFDNSGQGNSPIKCNYKEGGQDKDLKLTVAEDDDGSDKKMTVVIPGDRTKVTTNLYTTTVASEIAAIFSGTGATEAAYYTLSTITFRRCD